MYSFVCDIFESTLYLEDSSMLLCIAVVCSFSLLYSVLYEYTILCSFYCYWTFGLFPVFSYYE